MTVISSNDLIVQELAKNGFKLEWSEGELKIIPTVLRVDHLTVKRKHIGMWKRDPAIYGTDEDNIFWRTEIEAFATVNDEQVPIYFSNPESMITMHEERIEP